MFFDLNISYWAWFGTIYLIILTYQDYKNNRDVDDRKNYFMMGITFSLLSHVSRKIWYTLLIIALIIVLAWWLNKKDALGGADVTTISWIFLGLGIINPFKLAWFMLFFIVMTLAYTSLKNKVFKYKRPVPFYGVILLSFVFNCWLFGIYGAVGI